MTEHEIGRASIRLDLDSGPLERQAAALEARLGRLFGDMGRGMSERLRLSFSRQDIFSEWRRQTGRLRSELASLGDTMDAAFAAALTPAVRALNGFMGAVIKAANTFKAFVFSLCGQKSQDMAAGAAASLEAVGGSAAGTARKTAAAARSIRRSLMAFDEIQRLTEETGASGGGSGAGGLGDTASALVSEAYEVSGSVFGTLLRGLIDDEQFDAAGELIARRLGGVIDDLDRRLKSAKFQKRISKALENVTDGVNGFLTGITFSEGDKSSVAERIGGFFGDAASLALNSMHTVLSRLQWSNIGKAVAQFVNGGIRSVNAGSVSLGQVIAEWFNAQLSTLDGLLAELDWASVGRTVSKNISDLFNTVDWEAVGRVLREGIIGLKSAITEAVRSIDIRWPDILNDLFAGLTGEDAEKWMREHPFLARLLKGFQIPMEAALDSVSDGLTQEQKRLGGFSGMLEKLSDEKLTPLQKLVSGFTAVITGKKENLASKLIDMKANFTEWATAANWAPWSYVKAWFKDYDTAWGWNPWSYVKAWFKDYDTAWGWSPWSYIKGWFNSFDQTYTPTINAKANITEAWLSKNAGGIQVKAGGGVFDGVKWSPIQRYASGGAPGMGQLFVAREAGPELVGTLGGHTAVMNNDQIVASVSAGVARAMSGLRLYVTNAATPQLAVIGHSTANSERYLAGMAEQAREERVGGTNVQVLAVLQQILGLLQNTDPNVYMDGRDVTDRVVRIINQDTQATGRCAIVV